MNIQLYFPHSVGHNDLDSIWSLNIRVVLIGECSSLILNCDQGDHI